MGEEEEEEEGRPVDSRVEWGGSGISGGGEGLDQRERGNSRREGERKKGERDEVEWKFGISMEKEVYDFVSLFRIGKRKKEKSKRGLIFNLE